MITLSFRCRSATISIGLTVLACRWLGVSLLSSSTSASLLAMGGIASPAFHAILTPRLMWEMSRGVLFDFTLGGGSRSTHHHRPGTTITSSSGSPE